MKDYDSPREETTAAKCGIFFLTYSFGLNEGEWSKDERVLDVLPMKHSRMNSSQELNCIGICHEQQPVRCKRCTNSLYKKIEAGAKLAR